MDLVKDQLVKDVAALQSAADAIQKKTTADGDDLAARVKALEALVARVEAIEKRLAPKPSIFAARPRPQTQAQAKKA